MPCSLINSREPSCLLSLLLLLSFWFIILCIINIWHCVIIPIKWFQHEALFMAHCEEIVISNQGEHPKIHQTNIVSQSICSTNIGWHALSLAEPFFFFKKNLFLRKTQKYKDPSVNAKKKVPRDSRYIYLIMHITAKELLAYTCMTFDKIPSQTPQWIKVAVSQAQKHKVKCTIMHPPIQLSAHHTHACNYAENVNFAKNPKALASGAAVCRHRMKGEEYIASMWRPLQLAANQGGCKQEDCQ